jgi:Ni/Co efflux regulator RcnB
MKKLTILALAIALASPALAFDQKEKKHEKSKGKDNDQGENGDKGRSKSSSAQVTIVFGDTDRQVAHSYFEKQYGRGNCPPGLAKKNNGCLPPGQAKKRYVVGHALPREVVWVEPPHELVVALKPCPPGYKYVMVDGDLVKLAVGTMLVVDAIDGLLH